jgi:hypothetical protein
MKQTTCPHCGRTITFAHHQSDGHSFALERVWTYEIDYSPIGEWVAIPVEPLKGEEKINLYIAHSKVCGKRENT